MLLSAEQLSINFGSRQLLQDVDFYLNEGDKTGVIGINGTGKSTFLKVLAGLVQPDSGRISRRPHRHALRRRTPPRGFVRGAHPSGGRAGARRADEPP